MILLKFNMHVYRGVSHLSNLQKFTFNSYVEFEEVSVQEYSAMPIQQN